MSADPAAALQRAVFAALSDSPAGLRVFDRIPQPNPNEAEAAYRRRVQMPYVTIGDDDIIDDSNACFAASEAFVTVHVWSGAVGKMEAKAIGGAVRDALSVELAIDGFICTEAEFRDARYFTDPDGVTTHGVLSFRYLIDPT
ncbi:MAG: DUF3168 domain-containing protein [Hyphomonadaceae bacterium]